MKQDGPKAMKCACQHCCTVRRSIVLLPFAGAPENAFASLKGEIAQVANSVEVDLAEISSDVAGGETIQTLAEKVCELLKKVPGRIVIFGHSMGALIAFEAALRFEQERIERLVLSACPPPDEVSAPAGELGASFFPLDESSVSLKQPRKRSGTIVDRLERDLKILSRYVPSHATSLSIDIRVLSGASDKVAPPAVTSRWAQFTTQRFEHRIFSGGHFYFVGRMPELSA
ncbi:alpha/beta fold hydrolase, partial [Caballeronia jiangsuensis]